MTSIMIGSWTAHADRRCVAFIMGMPINRWWMVHRCLSRSLAMTSRAREFVQQPKPGRLGSAAWLRRIAAVIKDCWLLEAFATYFTARDFSKVSVWAGFSRKTGNDDTIGNYGEPSRMVPGWFEDLFANMPALLTGSCTILTGVWHEFAAAAGQMGLSLGDQNAGLNVSGRKSTNDQLSPHARPLVGSHR